MEDVSGGGGGGEPRALQLLVVFLSSAFPLPLDETGTGVAGAPVLDGTVGGVAVRRSDAKCFNCGRKVGGVAAGAELIVV